MRNTQKPYDKRNFWKSLRDYYDDPDVLKSKVNEFSDGVTEDFDPSKLSGISRRKFLTLLSASAAITATACSDYHDKGEIVPYNKRPEEVLPGMANFYASTCNGCVNSCGIIVKTREGRPIKIDGNPDHPINKGKVCAKGHASIYNLYDPERLSDPIINKRKADWLRVDREIIDILDQTKINNSEIAIITRTIASPTVKKVLDDFKTKYTNTKIYSYNLVGDNQRRQAWFECYGSYDYPSIKWENANVILSLDSDFLGNEGNFIENTLKYSSKRETTNGLNVNRLYVAEGRMSQTGMMADYRLKVSPDKQYQFVMALINEISKKNSVISIDAESRNKIEKYSLNNFVDVGKEKLNYLIKDLIENKGKSIIHAGDTLSKDVHTAVNLLNEILDNTTLYDYSSVNLSLIQHSTKEEIEHLISQMSSGKVDVVIHFDSNPVFHLPEDYGYTDALKNVKNIISLTESENESSVAGNFTLPINNQLESWGDAKVKSGVHSLQQPVISPIFNTRQKEAVLLQWIKRNPDSYDERIFHDYLMQSFKKEVYEKKNVSSDFKSFWLSSLHDGVVKIDESVNPNKINLSAFSSIKEERENKGYTVHLNESYFVGDGSFANNGWLQETPHPVTKIAWDNYASLSPETAKKLNVEMNSLIEINVSNRKLKLPVLVQPGMVDNNINIELGYGRNIIGEAGKDVGFNAVKLMSKNYEISPFIYTNASVEKVSGKYNLATTQEHHSLDDTFVKDFHRIRKIIQEGTVQQYQNDPHFLHHGSHDIFSITKEHEYTGVKWAMAIDLNKCTSCGVCVSACNVENNVPVVGKDQVERGREMQWMRIDRYYSGTHEEPVVSNQPMLCQHCDNAPCENVCPVNATNHSTDGLNQMAYNRCVGTRYCANNCPYKVRRFNFFDFRDHFADAYYDNNLTALVNNPEVTVRSRGVMEKCTFCVQRIMEARSDAFRDGRELKGDDVITACQQACPANAIVFGDANDPNSAVAKLRSHDLAYHVLEELNVKPNVTYIAKLRNTHSEEIS